MASRNASTQKDAPCCNKAANGRWWLAAAALVVLAVILWSSLQSGQPGPRDTGSGADPTGDRADDDTAASAPAQASSTRPAPPTLPTDRAMLHQALGEEAVSLPSDVVVEGIDTDRPWVCAGEPMGLSARVGGTSSEPGAVYRWVWPAAGGKAELHPGPAMTWQAPAVAGRYQVRFQVCKDLGGRRVGVLAERVVDIDVRACGANEGQTHEPLRIRADQRRHGAFAFHAQYQGDEPVTTYAWDFGDGTSATTPDAVIEHTYPVQELGPHDVDRFAVRLEARLPGGERLQAVTFVQVRGRPATPAPPAMDVTISRWRPRADGNGWQSDLTVRNPDEAGSGVTWDRLERVTKRFDGSADIDTVTWDDAIAQGLVAVDETLAGGGFRGRVRVDTSAVPPEVKQIMDYLYGHDPAGEETMVAWTPFKRPAPPEPPAAQAPPRK